MYAVCGVKANKCSEKPQKYPKWYIRYICHKNIQVFHVFSNHTDNGEVLNFDGQVCNNDK